MLSLYLCILLLVSSSVCETESNMTAVTDDMGSEKSTKTVETIGNKGENKTIIEMERIVQPISNNRVLDPLPSHTNISTKLEKVEGKSLNDFRPSPQLDETGPYEYNKFPVPPAYPEAKHLNSFSVGDYDSKAPYRPPENNIQWPSKNQEPPVLTTESPWTSRMKFPTTPPQRAREHHHHHYYLPPTGDPNKYSPPDRNNYIPPDGNKYLPPDGNKYLPPDGNKYLPPDGNKYLPPDGNKYLPPDGNKYLPPDGNKYLPPDGNKYLPPDGNKYLPPDGNKYLPPDGNKYLPPDNKKYSPPNGNPHKYVPPSGNSYLPPSSVGDKSYHGKYGPPSAPSGPQTHKHWLDGPNYRPSNFGSVSNVPISTSIGVWDKYENPNIGGGYDRRPPSTQSKTHFDFTSYDKPYIESGGGGGKFDVGKPYAEPQMSPWKKIIKILTAFIPIGLLISALTPTVITVTPMNNTDVRLRAQDPKREAAKRLISSLTYFNNLNGERCEDRILCELLLSASNSKNAEENVKNLLNNFTEQNQNAVDRAEEMKKIFDAVQNEDCSPIVCNTITDT